MKYFSIIFLSLCILSSCNKSENFTKKVLQIHEFEYYPINNQRNNLIIHFYDDYDYENSYIECSQYKIYFYMSDFQNRQYDNIFNFLIDRQMDTYLDIRIVNNSLILTDVSNQRNQKVIHFDEMYPDIFNDTTKNSWIVSEMNKNAIDFFEESGVFSRWIRRNYLKSFQICNDEKNIYFDISILAIAYREYTY